MVRSRVLSSRCIIRGDRVTLPQRFLQQQQTHRGDQKAWAKSHLILLPDLQVAAFSRPPERGNPLIGAEARTPALASSAEIISTNSGGHYKSAIPHPSAVKAGIPEDEAILSAFCGAETAINNTKKTEYRLTFVPTTVNLLQPFTPLTAKRAS